MAKYVDSLIDEIREATENEDFDDTIGLTEEEIIRYINDAQYRLHAKIIAQHPSVFTEQETYSIVADQEAYSIPFNAHLGNRIIKVEYSLTGSADDYYTLKTEQFRNSYEGADGHPCSYIRKDGQILLYPTPTVAGGNLRVTFVRRPKAIDKRRGLLSGSPTLTASEAWTISAQNSAAVDQAALQANNRVTVVDGQGNIKASNVLISAATSTSVTLDSSYSSVAGETVASGNYIISGPYSTTHLEFQPEVERYIRAYAEWKVLKRDSSIDSQEAVQELMEMEADIIASYADVDGDDIYKIPELRDDFLDWDM